MKRSHAAAIVALAIVSTITVAAVFESILAPPMVVSSRSMQHDDYKSHLGTLDTGDLVLIDYKKDPSDIVTYVQGASSNYTRFGEYGDVILFQTELSEIPIVHRAICRIEYNGDGTFNLKELKDLPKDAWSTSTGDVENLKGKVYLYNIGHKDATVMIDLDKIAKRMKDDPHSGFITMGDNNNNTSRAGTVGYIDQTYLSSVDAPIKNEEILGVVAAEIPWAGLLKLYVSGDAPDYTPINSIVSLAAVIVIGLVITAAVYLLLKKR